MVNTDIDEENKWRILKVAGNSPESSPHLKAPLNTNKLSDAIALTVEPSQAPALNENRMTPLQVYETPIGDNNLDQYFDNMHKRLKNMNDQPHPEKVEQNVY